MQGFEVSGFAVRRPFENWPDKRRTKHRTVTGHFSENANENNYIRVSGQLSGTVRQVANVRCLSGGVSLGRATPDTRTVRG